MVRSITQRADDERRQYQGRPVRDAQEIEQEPGHKGPGHVQGAMGEVDHVQHAEDHGQTETQQGVERAVDQPQQQLAEQGLGGYPQQFEHHELLAVAAGPGAPGPADLSRNDQRDR